MQSQPGFRTRWLAALIAVPLLMPNVVDPPMAVHVYDAVVAVLLAIVAARAPRDQHAARTLLAVYTALFTAVFVLSRVTSSVQLHNDHALPWAGIFCGLLIALVTTRKPQADTPPR